MSQTHKIYLISARIKARKRVMNLHTKNRIYSGMSVLIRSAKMITVSRRELQPQGKREELFASYELHVWNAELCGYVCFLQITPADQQKL